MKLSIFSFAASAMLAALSPAQARDAVVALSSAQAEVVLKAQAEQALQHLIQTMAPGETSYFYDATAVRRIGTFEVPEEAGDWSARRLANHNKAGIAALGRFIRSARQIPGAPGKIDLPGLLRTLRANAPAGEIGADLIVIGHPVHNPAKAPSQSMLGGRVPSDGHVAATPGQSVYATQGLAGSLEGYEVYFGLIGDDWSVSPPYTHHVKRFWTLSVEGHGASMAYIGDDLATLYARAGRDAPNAPHSEPLRSDEKIEMLTFAADDGSVPELFRTPLQEAPAAELVWRAASSVTIGITWEVEGADLDLYVRPNPSADVIYFNQADTTEGRLFKDFTLSPGTGFETVALKQPVDVSRLQLAVNYYGGARSPSSVRGELRLAIDDAVWAVPFHIIAPQGNRGNGVETIVRENIAPSAAWIIVEPLEVIGVR
ncbi:MAG: hypothetical protein AAFQ60_05750 [Pseudomonadota bacterium]